MGKTASRFVKKKVPTADFIYKKKFSAIFLREVIFIDSMIPCTKL